jgi:hypothetical protein
MPSDIRDLFEQVLKAVSQQERDDSADDADNAAVADHDSGCTCPRCCIGRFETPVPPVGDDLTYVLLRTLKDAYDATKRRLSKAGDTALALVLSPLSPEAEDVMLQLCVDTSAAAQRAEHALAALLPHDKRPPRGVLHESPPTLEKAREILEAGRELFQKTLNQRKAEAQAKDDAKTAVAQAIAQAAREAGGK